MLATLTEYEDSSPPLASLLSVLVVLAWHLIILVFIKEFPPHYLVEGTCLFFSLIKM